MVGKKTEKIKGSEKLEIATFAAGCFWGVEELFRTTPGVKETAVGYCGGKTDKPTYEDVCNNETGHAEAVEVRYDPKEISYQKLLEMFWKNHDPTTPNRQGPDFGTQYRSVVFFHSKEQEKTAKEAKEKLQKSFSKPIVTEIVPAQTFFKAEDYHQKYFMKRGGGTCHI